MQQKENIIFSLSTLKGYFLSDIISYAFGAHLNTKMNINFIKNGYIKKIQNSKDYLL